MDDLEGQKPEKYPPYPPRSWGTRVIPPPIETNPPSLCWRSMTFQIATCRGVKNHTFSSKLRFATSVYLHVFRELRRLGLSKTHLGSIFNLIKSSKKYDVISYYATVDGWNPKASHMGCSPNPVNNGKTTNLNWWVYRISSTVLHYTFWRSLSLVS